jgi:hypothetical protein
MAKKKRILSLLVPLLAACQNGGSGSIDFDAVNYFFTEESHCDKTAEIIYFRKAVNQDFTRISSLYSPLVAQLKETTFTPATGRVGRNLIKFNCSHYVEEEKITKIASFYLADDFVSCSFSFVEDYVYSPSKEYPYTLSFEEGQCLYLLVENFAKGEAFL